MYAARDAPGGNVITCEGSVEPMTSGSATTTGHRRSRQRRHQQQCDRDGRHRSIPRRGVVGVTESRHTGPGDRRSSRFVDAVDAVLQHTGVERQSVEGIGLATPGPASPTGVTASTRSTNFVDHGWRSFDYRGALERRLGVPVTYINDGNAAALYAHTMFFGPEADRRSSMSAIVGTGLGGGVVESGRVVVGATGTAAELGHIRLQLDGVLAPGQPIPRCNCGATGDVESFASLTRSRSTSFRSGWVSTPTTRSSGESLPVAAKRVRSFGERGDEMARRLFEQQAMAIGRLFSLGANFLDADALLRRRWGHRDGARTSGNGSSGALPEHAEFRVEQSRGRAGSRRSRRRHGGCTRSGHGGIGPDAQGVTHRHRSHRGLP